MVETEDHSRLPLLMTPGPVSVASEVLDAMAEPLIFHRYETFEELFERVTQGLCDVFHATPQHDCVLFTGSGTLANEAVLSSCFGLDDKVLVASNGEFGDRLIRTLTAHGVPVIAHRRPDYSILEPEPIIEAAVRERATGVAMVALETSTGIVNPVAEIGHKLRALGSSTPALFVDAISALGGEVVNVGEAGITYCTSVLNKALEGPTGLSFACVDRTRFYAREYRKHRSTYLNLATYLDFALRRQTPWTPAIPLIRALEAALKQLREETLDGRRSRYLHNSGRLRERLQDLGFEPLGDIRAQKSVAVANYGLPPDVDAVALRRYLERRGYVLWFPPANDPRHRMIASVMGIVTEDDIERVADLISRFMREPGDDSSDSRWRPV
jgi:2-aminoethylphosphonate-pyruvate transaminase